MITERDIDFTSLNAVIAEGIINQLGGEPLRYAVLKLIRQGASKEDVQAYILEELRLTTWKKTVIQIGVVFDYLKNGGGEE